MKTFANLCLLVALTVSLAGAQPAPENLAPVVAPDQIDSVREQEDPLFLDVRSAAEIQEFGSLPGYYHIPIDELESRLDELPRDREILTA